jgi:hypothetical protein
VSAKSWKISEKSRLPSELFWRILGKNTQREASIFAASKEKNPHLFGSYEKTSYLCSVKRGFRRKDDNLYGLRGRFEPQK